MAPRSRSYPAKSSSSQPPGENDQTIERVRSALAGFADGVRRLHIHSHFSIEHLPLRAGGTAADLQVGQRMRREPFTQLCIQHRAAESRALDHVTHAPAISRA